MSGILNCKHLIQSKKKLNMTALSLSIVPNRYSIRPIGYSNQAYSVTNWFNSWCLSQFHTILNLIWQVNLATHKKTILQLAKTAWQSENIVEDFGKKEEKNRPVNGPFTVFYVCNLIKITITSPLIVAHLAQRCFLSIKREKMVYFYGGMPFRYTQLVEMLWSSIFWSRAKEAINILSWKVLIKIGLNWN